MREWHPISRPGGGHNEELWATGSTSTNDEGYLYILERQAYVERLEDGMWYWVAYRVDDLVCGMEPSRMYAQMQAEKALEVHDVRLCG